MFRAEIISSYLKEIVDALKVRSDYYILVHASPDGLRTRFIDIANVFMVDAKVPSTAFDKYPINTELEMAIELSRLSTFVESVDDNGQNEEQITMEYDETNHTLSLASKYLSTIQKQITPYQMRHAPKLLNIDLQGIATIKSEDFVRAITSMYNMKAPEGLDGCDYVKMGIRPIHTTGKEGTFYMEAKFDEGKKGFDPLRFEKPCSGTEPISTSNGKEVQSIFSMDYLGDMRQVIKKVGNIDIMLGTDVPGIFKFTLPRSGAAIEYTYACRERTDGEEPSITHT